MIKIDVDNGYLDEFINNVEVKVEKNLTLIINEKMILGNKSDVKTPKNHSKYIYSTEKGKEKQQLIKYKISLPKELYCLRYLRNNLNSILRADIKQQRNYILQVLLKCKMGSKSNLFEIIKYIFIEKGYESIISKSKKKEIAYKLVQSIGVNSCPYCNRNYISVISDTNIKKNITRPQLDHFFPKDTYPFLACSFYNLIPSCSTCNHMKSNKNAYLENLVSPYEITNNTFKFSYTLNNTDILNIGIQESSKYDYKDSINIIFDKKNETNEKYFELEKLYNQEHRDVVIELLVKKAYYPQSYINELSNFGFGQDEIYRYLFSNYNQDDDLHKRPLSKLVRDISEELGLLK